MTLKNKILAAILAGLLISVVITSILSVQLHKRLKSAENRIVEQTTVIDSLLTRRMKVVDVHLYVTDKSKFNIYGRYNKGSITAPSEKVYTLKIDSTNIMLK